MKKENWLFKLIIMSTILLLANSCKKDEEGPSIVKDIDGNVYHTVTIGTQEWMVENLKTTKYLNGDLIGTTSPATLDIYNEIEPKYQWAQYYWDNSGDSIVAIYGRLYTWYTVADNRNICPSGWHVPSEAEWLVLETFLGDWQTAGGKLKETGTTHWNAPNTGATNETGFTALPGGNRDYSNEFDDLGLSGYWWSSSSSTTDGSGIARKIDSYDSGLYHDEGSSKKHSGYSVRCIKDL